jgi:hypothetical protein
MGITPIWEPRKDFNDYDVDVAYTCVPTEAPRIGRDLTPDGPKMRWNPAGAPTHWEVILHVRLKGGDHATLAEAEGTAPSLLAAKLRKLADILDNPDRYKTDGRVSEVNMNLLG